MGAWSSGVTQIMGRVVVELVVKVKILNQE